MGCEGQEFQHRLKDVTAPSVGTVSSLINVLPLCSLTAEGKTWINIFHGLRNRISFKQNYKTYKKKKGKKRMGIGMGHKPEPLGGVASIV